MGLWKWFIFLLLQRYHLWGSMIAVIFQFHFTKSISISNVIPQIFLLTL